MNAKVLTLKGLNSFFFRRFSGHNLKIGSFRLPTHRRDAHRKFFFDGPFLNRIEISIKGDTWDILGVKGLIKREFSIWFCYEGTFCQFIILFPLNLLVTSVHKSARITKISILKLERIIQKILWASRLWVCRRKGPILDTMSIKTMKIEFRQ